MFPAKEGGQGQPTERERKHEEPSPVPSARGAATPGDLEVLRSAEGAKAAAREQSD